MFWRWALSRLDYLVGGMFLVWSVLLVLFNLREFSSIRTPDEFLGAWPLLILIGGYGGIGAAVVWAGIAVGDEERRLPVALQVVAVGLAALGVGASVFFWKTYLGISQGGATRAASLTGGEAVLLLLVLALLVVVVAGISFVAGAILSYISLRRARRRVGDATLASRLATEGPSDELIATFAARGVPPRFFWLSHVGDTLGARGQLVVYATSGVAFSTVAAWAVAQAWSSASLLVSALLLVMVVVVVGWAATVCVARATRAWCIVRRSRRFPLSATYVYRASRCLPDGPIDAPAPYADGMADVVEAWSIWCQRAADRIMPAAMLIGLILMVLVVVDRSGVKRIF